MTSRVEKFLKMYAAAHKGQVTDVYSISQWLKTFGERASGDSIRRVAARMGGEFSKFGYAAVRSEDERAATRRKSRYARFLVGVPATVERRAAPVEVARGCVVTLPLGVIRRSELESSLKSQGVLVHRIPDAIEWWKEGGFVRDATLRRAELAVGGALEVVGGAQGEREVERVQIPLPRGRTGIMDVRALYPVLERFGLSHAEAVDRVAAEIAEGTIVHAQGIGRYYVPESLEITRLIGVSSVRLPMPRHYMAVLGWWTHDRPGSPDYTSMHELNLHMRLPCCWSEPDVEDYMKDALDRLLRNYNYPGVDEILDRWHDPKFMVVEKPDPADWQDDGYFVRYFDYREQGPVPAKGGLSEGTFPMPGVDMLLGLDDVAED